MSYKDAGADGKFTFEVTHSTTTNDVERTMTAIR